MNRISATIVWLALGVFFIGCEEKQTITEDNLAVKTEQKNKTKNKTTVLNLKTIESKKIKLTINKKAWKFEAEGYDNKIVLLDFFATWCPPCIKSIPHLNDIADKYKKDVVVLGLEIGKSGTGEIEDIDILKEFVMKHDIKYEITNGKVTNELMFGLKSLNEYGSIPFVVIFDKQGTYSDSFLGMTSQEDLENQINKILKEAK